jgi:hypothetical protein
MIDKHLNKESISVASTSEFEDSDTKYWKLKTPNERLEAIEFMRQINFGYDPSTERLQRFLTIAERT